jgi:hypothetical protein
VAAPAEGEEVPRLARIVAVADAFDAMVFDTPYRRGQPVEIAFAEIERELGRQFAPNVATAFLQIRERIAAIVCNGCLLFVFHLLLQGVAQLDPTGEGLAKRPETAEEIRGRLQSAFGLLSIAVCGSFVFQAAGVLSSGGKGWRSRVRKAAFVWIVFWAGVCLFFCLLIFAASFQARWEVAGVYYWLAGGAGVLTLVLLGTAEFFADGKRSQPTEPRIPADQPQF